MGSRSPRALGPVQKATLTLNPSSPTFPRAGMVRRTTDRADYTRRPSSRHGPAISRLRDGQPPQNGVRIVRRRVGVAFFLCEAERGAWDRADPCPLPWICGADAEPDRWRIDYFCVLGDAAMGPLEAGSAKAIVVLTSERSHLFPVGRQQSHGLNARYRADRDSDRPTCVSSRPRAETPSRRDNPFPGAPRSPILRIALEAIHGKILVGSTGSKRALEWYALGGGRYAAALHLRSHRLVRRGARPTIEGHHEQSYPAFTRQRRRYSGDRGRARRGLA
jgi:hypothetical protein